MEVKKVGRKPTGSHKIHLALPKDIGEWVAEKAENTPFCKSRQDYIVGLLDQIKKKEQREEQLELEV